MPAPAFRAESDDDEAPADPHLRWVVALESHLKGPWTYCARLRQLVDGCEPVQTYVRRQGKHQVRVFVFDRQAKAAAGALAHGPSSVQR